MNRIIPALLIGIIVDALATWFGLERHDNEHVAAEKKEEEHKEERVSHAENGDTIIKLDKESLEHAGFKTTAVAVAEAAPERKAYGRVLDAAPLAAMLSDIQAAEIVGMASKQELDRLKVLEKQNNTSAKAVEAAEAAAKRDEVQAGALRVKLMAAWGKTIGELPQLHEHMGALVTLENALVRLDLPAGEWLTEAPAGVRLVTLAKPEESMSAKFLGPLPAVDPQAQGQALLFLLSSNPQQLTPGTALTGWLKIPGAAKKGVLVPHEAVVRFNGLRWAYVKIGDGRFTRREVASEQLVNGGWLVTSAFKSGDEIVTTGAQQLLSEELKGAPE